MALRSPFGQQGGDRLIARGEQARARIGIG
jgi:hypothetical protein